MLFAAFRGGARVAVAVAAAAQAIVPVGQEPHHHFVYEDARLRVLDVNIPSKQSTLPHRHDSDLLFISVGPTITRTKTPETDWGPLRPPRPLGEVGIIDYAGQPGVHTIETVGADPYLLIAVENVKLGGWDAAVPPQAGPGVTVAAEGRAFRASSMHLRPGETMRVHATPTVFVLISGEAAVVREGKPDPLSVRRRWSVVGPGQPVVLATREGAHLVEVEVR